ncbi:MAG TPA: hypothetical protein DC057_12410 [Spirochaetia bacterium]|nr:hypothetical protein [Spirochaetia bacterium]
MPDNLYTQNSELWKSISHIDYFTQFVKAWIPFNAWYKNYFPQLKTDKEAIDTIKSTNNNFRDKLLSLISGSSMNADVLGMKGYISNLHYELERHYINNQGRRITFTNIVIEMNTKLHEELLKNSWKYEATRDRGNYKQIEIKITDRHSRQKLLINQVNGYDIDEIKRNQQYLSLQNNQQKNIEYCYSEINPYKPINLLTSGTETIQLGNYHFINDSMQICKAVITILYLMRNSLFHGEIIPDKNTSIVYEQAYNILHRLIIDL